MPYECSQSITTLYVCAYVWNTIGISYKLVETNNLYFQALFNIALHVHLSDVEKGTCHSQLCLHNGTCIEGADDFTCTCESGWVGPTCGEGMIDLLYLSYSFVRRFSFNP